MCTSSLKNSLLILIIANLFFGCDMFKIKQDVSQDIEDKTPAARVFDSYLYLEDLEGLTSEAINTSDSSDIADRYIRSWIKKQLLINKASEEIDFDEAALSRKILDYRYALMVHEYKQYHISQNLPTEVTDEEIQQYYNDHQDNFELKQNIIRGIFIKLPDDAPRLSKVGKLIRSKKVEDRNELASYCYQFASFYSLEDTVWLNFDDVIKNTPLSSIPNQEQYLKRNKYVETSDQNLKYFLYIYEYKITDQISPIEFVRDNIAEIIVNRRKIDLANDLEGEIYSQALKNNDFEIYEED